MPPNDIRPTQAPPAPLPTAQGTGNDAGGGVAPTAFGGSGLAKGAGIIAGVTVNGPAGPSVMAQAQLTITPNSMAAVIKTVSVQSTPIPEHIPHVDPGVAHQVVSWHREIEGGRRDVLSIAPFIGVEGERGSQTAGVIAVLGNPGGADALLHHMYGGHHGDAWRMDPNLGHALTLANAAAQSGQPSVTVFLPMPSAVRPEFDGAPVTVHDPTPSATAPNGERALNTPGQHGAQKNGVSLRSDNPAKNDGAKPDGKAELKPGDKRAEQQQELGDPNKAALRLPREASREQSLISDHGFYVGVRQDLSRAFGELGRLPPDAARLQQAALQRCLEQCLRLDVSARDFLGRPSGQRELAFQRNLFFAMIVSNTPKDAAFAELFEYFGARLGYDAETLMRLARSLTPLPQQAAPLTELEKQEAQKRLMMERQLAQQAQTQTPAKQKQGRLPEEMLLDNPLQKQAQAAKDSAARRRVEKVGKDSGRGSGQHQGEAGDEQDAEAQQQLEPAQQEAQKEAQKEAPAKQTSTPAPLAANKPNT